MAEVSSNEIRRWTKPYQQFGRHRKKCRACRKLVQDGEMTTFIQWRDERYYPVKGTMVFARLAVWHEGCLAAWNAAQEVALVPLFLGMANASERGEDVLAYAE